MALHVLPLNFNALKYRKVQAYSRPIKKKRSFVVLVQSNSYKVVKIAMPTWAIMLPYCLPNNLTCTDAVFCVLVLMLLLDSRYHFLGLDWSEPSHCSDSDDD